MSQLQVTEPPALPSAVAPSQYVNRTTDRPSAFEALSSLVSHRELLKNLVLRDLKLKYRGSVLGFLWSLANPLSMVIVYTVAFRYILRIGDANLPFRLLLGVLAWTFFGNAATMSTGAIIDSGGMIRSVRFPRAVLPVAVVLFNLAQYLLTVVAFVPILLLMQRMPPAWPMLAFPVVLLFQVAFTIGVALLLGAATTYFRDVRHLVEVALPMLFWLTPIVYAIDDVPEVLRPIILSTPMSPFIATYQRLFIDRAWPEPAAVVLVAVYAVVMLAIGAVVFRSLEDDLGERL